MLLQSTKNTKALLTEEPLNYSSNFGFSRVLKANPLEK
jgi:hypothetical protein